MSEESIDNIEVYCGDCADGMNKTIYPKDVKVGDHVKYKFPLPKEDHVYWVNRLGRSITHERMWIRVKKIEGDQVTGILENVPAFIRSELKCGDEIQIPFEDVVDHLPQE